MKRIVKETLKDGYIQYRVQKKNWLGIWVTDTQYHYSLYGMGCSLTSRAIFPTLELAKEFCGHDLKVVKKEIVL